MGEIDLNTLSDVIIKVEYTALQGGDTLAGAVKSKLKPVNKSRIFNLAHEFPNEWHEFLQDPAQGLKCKLTRPMFPNMNANQILGAYLQYELTATGGELGNVSMIFSGIELTNAKYRSLKDLLNLTISEQGTEITLIPKGEAAKFTPERIKNIGLVLEYSSKVTF